MSAYLLDTNAFSMMLAGDPRLPVKVRHALEDADQVSVSVISLFEIGQKVRLGKWPEMVGFSKDMQNRTSTQGFDLVPLTATAASKASLLEWTNRDPFDRMIAAVSIEEGLPLVSSDAAFDELDMKRVW